MHYRSIKLTLATLALAASGGYAQAATFTASSTATATFAGLESPVFGFTGVGTSVGFDMTMAANGLSIDRNYQWTGAAIAGGAFTDKVSATLGTEYSFTTGVTAFFGQFNMNPLGEDGTDGNAFTNVNDLKFDFYSGSNILAPSFILAAPTSNSGLTFDFGLRVDTGSFDRFVIYSAGGGGLGEETYQMSNLQFAAAVPEPETYAMLLAGLGAVGFMARRRRTA